MKNRFLKNIFTLLVVSVALTSCFKDLDTLPKDPNVDTPNNIYKEKANYRSVLAKLYAGLAVSGQKGPSGKPDISGQDEGYGQYLRGYFYLQEYTTDEAVIGWGDGTLQDLHGQCWTASDGFIQTSYYRIFFQVVGVNEFLRETTDSKLSERGHADEEFKAEVAKYRAEARFLRALSYWHAIDLFGNVPFVTEDDKVGSFFPKQATRKQLFDYIESELKDIENDLAEPRANEYGRADKAAAWTLLAKLYLNAEVYVNENKYAQAAEYANKVVESAYTLYKGSYAEIFMGDNDREAIRGEVIFPIRYSSLNTKTFGGTSFIIHAAIGGSMKAIEYGMDGGWGGHRATKNLVNLFESINDKGVSPDKRASFFTDGQVIEIDDITKFTQGYAVTKFSNRKSTDTDETLVGAEFADTDFPMFRISDVYLMYVEALLRDGKTLDAKALGLLNEIRERAYSGTAGEVNANDVNLNWILDERGRELYWEGHRRTDLVRFKKFSETSYVWPWKGGVKEGKSVDSKFDLFPLPAPDVAANPNLTQNKGY